MVDIVHNERETTERDRDIGEITDESAVETCPECDGTLEQDQKHGETVCVECGFIVSDDEIDHGAEWRAHTHEEREQRSRVGAPTTNLMHDGGVSTEIGWQDKDAYGNTLSASQRQKMNRLRTWHTRIQTHNHKDRNLKQALGEINRMASALGLPTSIQETASMIYRRALDEDLLRGRSIEGVSSAAIYAAARQAGSPRTLDEVHTVSRVEKLSITRTYQYVTRELGLEIEPADPLAYLPRLISDLDLPEETEHRSRELLTTVTETKPSYLSGKNPVGLAAAAIYAGALLTNEKVTQTAVGDVADISVVTIRNRYRDLIEIEGETQAP
ncbi:transcription initiation factor IIB 2 (plasmid) [Halococcus dombrowskii]|uniref:Transcription initiation factor IIB n=2 Tax=Halococcus TaxID=2249 RepID=A0AAV3SBI1_HALDO|nr:TFIIB-type zinc ribbon-containing protein [Halococcus dombrowskii]UOO96869.1 transcription initiation factor IIB 2 [Halococcus dombrowskii]